MNITVLGSGSSVQFEGRGSASFLIETSGQKILLDAGFFLLDRLERADVMADQIDAVYISHKHPDHFMGLIHLLFALKNKFYQPKNKLTIIGFEGIRGWVEAFQGILGHWIEPDCELCFCEGSGAIEDIRWETFPTVHSPESTGIILETDKHKLVYTGDTEYFDKLCEYTEKADMLIAECGSGSKVKNKGHMSPNDLVQIAKISTVGKILMTHIYPETDSTPSRWEVCETELMRSYDLQRISL